MLEFSLSNCLAVLSRTPSVLQRLLLGIPDEWTQQNYGHGTWSAHEVIGHLIWGERTDWIPRVRHILSCKADQAFPAFDRNGHAALCRECSTDELLRIFASERESQLSELRQRLLTADQLQSTGIHPALGVVSLSQLLATWTVHDLNHISQICKAMACQYQSAVGPWESYLSILAPPNPR